MSQTPGSDLHESLLEGGIVRFIIHILYMDQFEPRFSEECIAGTLLQSMDEGIHSSFSEITSFGVIVHIQLKTTDAIIVQLYGQ